jgi:hypothetical protein
MTDAEIRDSCVAALKLQRERSSTYQQWTLQFYRALIGDVTPNELQRSIQGIILPAFQRVSTSLRTLQRSLTEQAEKDGSSIADNKHSTQQRLVRWIDQLQELEREHYDVTLSLVNKLVDHCASNLLCASAATDGESQGKEAPQPASNTASQSREVAPVDITSLFKPADSDDEQDPNNEWEWREPRSTGYPPVPTPAPEEKEESATATLCVHDGGRCALLRLIPPRYHTHLFFVDCKDGLDELRGASDLPDSSASPASKQSDGDDDDELLPVYPKERSETAAGNTQRGTPLAFYRPSTISRRCVDWSHTVEPVAHRQDALRATIEELCEELQSEISDM